MSVLENLIHLPTPVTEIFDPLFEEKKVRVLVKRDDLTHLYISGNKYRKLKYNVELALNSGIKNLMTFGGAYSNHIAAFAETCKILNLNGRAIIRGEELSPDSNPTLKRANECGIDLIFVNRNDYQDKEKLSQKYGHGYWVIPEGGSNEFALGGVSELLDEQKYPDFVITAMGTGGTFAGLVSNKNYSGKVLGIPVLKNAFFLKQDVNNFLGNAQNDKMLYFFEYHFGGYGKYNQILLDFIQEFESKHAIQIEHVYTAKMIFAAYDLIKTDYFPQGSEIMLLHTGGLQGKLKI
jgi:1-aminocyclopropane-1-carboxylate deaminase